MEEDDDIGNVLKIIRQIVYEKLKDNFHMEDEYVVIIKIVLEDK